MGFGLDDLDPTNPSNYSFDAMGMVPGIGPLVQGYGAKKAADNERRRREEEAARRQAFYDEIGRQYAGIPGLEATKTRAAELGDLRTREIDQGVAGATRSIAGSYSRRGMGGSGYAASTTSQALQMAADERGRARASALDQAVAEGQKGLLGQAQISHMGDPFLSQMLSTSEGRYDAALAQAIRDRDEYQKMLLNLMGQAAGAGGGGGQASAPF